jgi:hypothetical protein
MAAIPKTVEEIDRSWFASVLDDEVRDARIVEVIHGTATKVKVDLQLVGPGLAPRTQTVWVKTGLEPHSKSIGTEKVYAGETFFYRFLGGKYETRTPACLFADTDSQGNSAIVLDDLCKHGARFMDATQAGSPDLIGRGLEAIARYQAASWMAPEIHESEWLRFGGSYEAGDVLAWIWNPQHWEDYSKLPRFKLLHPKLRDRELLCRAHHRLRDTWRLRKPWALSHGDAHYGQMYTLPNGEARFLDWQCCQVAHWAYDVSYFMVSGLSVDDRRRHARDLLEQYLNKLTELGVDAPSVNDAFEAFRAYALHGIGWVMCMDYMQPENVCSAMTERFSAAMMDLGSLDIVLRG